MNRFLIIFAHVVSLVFASFDVDSLVSSPSIDSPHHRRLVSYLAPCERGNLVRPDFSATPWHDNTREELLKSCFTEGGGEGKTLAQQRNIRYRDYRAKELAAGR